MLRMITRCLLRRRFSNLPTIRVDGTKMQRVPYPTYARYALLGCPIILTGLYSSSYYLNQDRPTHPFKDLMQVFLHFSFYIWFSILKK